MRKRRWSNSQLGIAVESSRSVRQVLIKIGLRETGGNYSQVKKYIKELNIDTTHFKGRAWNKGIKRPFLPKIPLSGVLKKNSSYQSYKLKRRLFSERLKSKKCELCGWHKISEDGRIPLELDHINGDRKDNRLSNLRILCPNCHSLQPTHRGLNSKKL